jgi:hypothetical protein
MDENEATFLGKNEKFAIKYLNERGFSTKYIKTLKKIKKSVQNLFAGVKNMTHFNMKIVISSFKVDKTSLTHFYLKIIESYPLI